MSFPYNGRRFTFTQPDGTTIDVLGFGDQYKAVFETLDGYTVVPDSKGFYRYAELSPDEGALVATAVAPGSGAPTDIGLAKGLRAKPTLTRALRAPQNDGLILRPRRCEERWKTRRETRLRALASPGTFRAPPSRGTVGKYRGLCILVEFPEEKGAIPSEEVTKFCNQPGYKNFGNNGSVYDYYVDNSHGRFEYTNVVTQYYTAKNPKSYYADTKRQFGQRAAELITEALESLKASGFDFSGLSVDSDGFVYAVNVFYAGNCPNDWGKGLWPHSYSLPKAVTLGPGRKAYDYQITNIGSDLSLATFCHENGHMVCDFPDFYDYGYESFGVGNYCLMAFSGDDPKNPVNICAYLRYKAGWYESVKAIANGMEYVAEREAKELLWYPKSMTEYFLLENRQKSRRDASLPGSGLMIWHIDETGSNNSEQMTTKAHYECALEQADGRFDLEHKANYGDGGDFFSKATKDAFSDATTPGAKWWDGTPSGLDIREIGASGDRMGFRVGASAPVDTAGLPIEKKSTPNVAIPDNSKAGVSDVIDCSDAGNATVGSVEVDVQIRHTYQGDLRVSLKSPAGTTAVLHDRNGGGADDLRKRFDAASAPDLANLTGEAVSGRWTLLVQDLAKSDTGVLEAWTLHVTPRVSSAVTLGEDPGVAIPDGDRNGITRSLDCAQAGALDHVEVDVDITHTYIGDLVVKLVSPAGTEVLLHDQKGGDADNLVATFTPKTTPKLDELRGQSMKGAWKLLVSDRAGQDTGKLAGWKLRLTRKA